MAKPTRTIAISPGIGKYHFEIRSDLTTEQIQAVRGVEICVLLWPGRHSVHIDPRYDADEVLAEITALAEGNDAWMDAVGDLPLDE